jgi:fatty acid-binding protein DegV
LEFLHHCGRIAAILGTASNMKPVLALSDGRVEAVECLRTKGKAIDRVLELVSEKIKGQSPIRLTTLHANAPQEARTQLDRATKELNTAESILTEVSLGVGNHAGPGAVGLACMAGL